MRCNDSLAYFATISLPMDTELVIKDKLCHNSTRILLNYIDIQMNFRMETQKNIGYAI